METKPMRSEPERARTNAPGTRISRATLTSQLEEALTLDILQGALEPGTRLRVGDMAERYGVSATPLREALQRLAMENLVDLDPRLGATVARISEADLRDVYAMMELLDGHALERSIGMGTDSWRQDVERRFHTLAEAIAHQESMGDGIADDTRHHATLSWSDAHWQFHYALYGACNSPWLLRLVSNLHQHAERYRMLSASRHLRGRRDSRGEHEEIMLAALSGDADAAVFALRTHLRRTVSSLLAESGYLVATDSSSPK